MCTQAEGNRKKGSTKRCLNQIQHIVSMFAVYSTATHNHPPTPQRTLPSPLLSLHGTYLGFRCRARGGQLK